MTSQDHPQSKEDFHSTGSNYSCFILDLVFLEFMINIINIVNTNITQEKKGKLLTKNWRNVIWTFLVISDKSLSLSGQLYPQSNGLLEQKTFFYVELVAWRSSSWLWLQNGWKGKFLLSHTQPQRLFFSRLKGLQKKRQLENRNVRQVHRNVWVFPLCFFR